MALLTSIISWINIKRISQLNLVKKYPIEVQAETFQQLILSAKDTE